MRAANALVGLSLVGLAVIVACGSDGKDSLFVSGAGDAGADASGIIEPPGFGNDTPDTGPTQAFDTDVRAVMTTDNAYSFGYGDSAKVTTFFQGEGSGGDAIFDCPVGNGPKAYTIAAKDAPSSAFLYIIAWADRQVTQGTLAQFTRLGGNTIYSGDAAWQVCAVGKEFAFDGLGPSNAQVNADIADCNSGASYADAGPTYSHGWVNKDGPLPTTPGARGKLAIGELNDNDASAQSDFKVVCQVDATGDAGIAEAARWMWFDPGQGNPFVGNDNNRTKTYLIFRLPASALPSNIK